MKDVIIKCGKGEVKKTLAYIEKNDRKVKWATGDKPTGWGSLFERRGVYLIIECDVLTFIEIDELDDSDKKGKTVVSADEFLGKSKSPHIVIFRRGREVIAKDVATVNEGVAKCSPDDEFVFKTGASIAMARLIAQIPEVITGDVAAEWKKTLGIADTAKPESKFKLGDFVTLKEDVEANKWYGGLRLLSGAMYDNAYNKRMTVVRVDWSDNSNTYFCECKGDSRFTTFHYSEQMLDKWDESVIHEGDKVRIKKGCTGDRFDLYYEWVKEHISDPDLLLAFERGNHIDTSLDYEVVKIAPHKVQSRTLAYIKYKDDYRTLCYLFNIEALEKV